MPQLPGCPHSPREQLISLTARIAPWSKINGLPSPKRSQALVHCELEANFLRDILAASPSTCRVQHGTFLIRPSWPRRANHIGVFRQCGLDVKQYRYYEKESISLDLDGMIQDIKVIPTLSVSHRRPLQRAQLFCFMRARTTQRVLILLTINGKPSQKHAAPEIISFFLIWHTYPSPLAILI